MDCFNSLLGILKHPLPTELPSLSVWFQFLTRYPKTVNWMFRFPQHNLVSIPY